MPPEHQAVHRATFNALTDIYQAFTAQHAQISSIQSSIASKTSSSSSAASTGVSASQAASQAANIATQTIQSTFGTPNNQTGTSYTPLNSDYAGIITLDNASPVAVSLTNNGTGILEQFFTFVQNNGAGTATLTPVSPATINGATSISLVQNQGAIIFFDGTEWFAVTSIPGSSGTITDVIAGTGLTGGGSSGSVTLALSTPVSVGNGGSGTATPGLVAGTGISVTGTWPDQTISATTGGVTSLNTLTGALALTQGANITITPSGSNIQIAQTVPYPTVVGSQFSTAPTSSGFTYTSPALPIGFYRMSAYAVCTTGTGVATVAATLNYTDTYGAQTFPMISFEPTTGGYAEQSTVFYNAVAANQPTLVFTVSGGTVSYIAQGIVVERLG